MEERFDRWSLGDLVIDAGAQTVVRGSRTLAVPKLSFQFLIELVRAHPNVLSVEELMERVWTGIFVNAETVTQRAKLLRDALGDDPREPRYFVARRGIGYQVVASPVPLGPAHEAGSTPRWPLRWKLAVAALLLAPAVLLGAFAYDRTIYRPYREGPLRIAVLPFENLSSDPADAYIAQGIPEMVLNRLSSVPGLTVISRESALVSKAATASPSEAARELGADFVVKGSVQRQGAKLRVVSFVLDRSTGTRLWSQSYDWPVERLYALQDRIAGEVAQALAGQTSASLKLAAQTASGAGSDAYLAYLKGRSLLGRFRVSDTEAAAKQFQRAVELDPRFVPALVSLYDAKMQAASLRSEDLGPVRQRYEPLLERAQALDPKSGPLLFAKAMWSDLSREERLALFAEAAKRDPSNSRGLVAYAFLLEWSLREGPTTVLGRQLMDKVMAIDPLSADAQFWAVQRHVLSKTPAEIESDLRRVLALDPDNILVANRYANRRWRNDGETAEAIGLMERVLASDPEYARSTNIAFAMYLDVGDLAAARAVANSTPATRQASKLVLALYDGNVKAAGEAALGPRSFIFNQYENWLWSEAVRDYALQTGELDRGAQAIATRYGFDLSAPRVTALHQETPAIPLAQILLAQGKTVVANRLLAEAIRWIDDHPKLGLSGGTGRSKAGALLLLGQRDAALSTLLATTRDAHDTRHCWYLVDKDPVWAPVRGDPRFREIAAVCAAAQRKQRALLDAARRAGKVPRRGG